MHVKIYALRSAQLSLVHMVSLMSVQRQVADVKYNVSLANQARAERVREIADHLARQGPHKSIFPRCNENHDVGQFE